MKAIKVTLVGISWLVFFSYLFVFGVFAYVAHFGEQLSFNKVLAMIGGGLFSAMCFGAIPAWLLGKTSDECFKLRIVDRYGKDYWDAFLVIVSTIVPVGLIVALILAWIQMYPKAVEYYYKFY